MKMSVKLLSCQSNARFSRIDLDPIDPNWKEKRRKEIKKVFLNVSIVN